MKHDWFKEDFMEATSSVSTLSRLLEILKSDSAKLCVIEGKNCFVVGFDTFHYAYEQLGKSSELYTSAVLTKAHFHNFEIRTVPEENYYLVTPTEPVLDKLWKEKYKPPVDAKG